MEQCKGGVVTERQAYDFTEVLEQSNLGPGRVVGGSREGKKELLGNGYSFSFVG